MEEREIHKYIKQHRREISEARDTLRILTNRLDVSIQNLLKFEIAVLSGGSNFEVKNNPPLVTFPGLPLITIYTDGACSGNPGNYGYAGIIINEGGKEIPFVGGGTQGTNNIAELLAIIEGVKRTSIGSNIIIYSDSQLCVEQGNGNWKRNKNLNLWEKFDMLKKERTVVLKWVKGHADNSFNNKVDRMATEECKRYGNK